jgi:hypothetical protein
MSQPDERIDPVSLSSCPCLFLASSRIRPRQLSVPALIGVRCKKRQELAEQAALSTKSQGVALFVM